MSITPTNPEFDAVGGAFDKIQDMPEAVALLTSESIPACTPSHSFSHAHAMPSYSQQGDKAERALVVAGLAVAPGVAAGVATATGEDAVTAGEPAGLVDWAMGDASVGDVDMPGLAGLVDAPGDAENPGLAGLADRPGEADVPGDPAGTIETYVLPGDASRSDAVA